MQISGYANKLANSKAMKLFRLLIKDVRCLLWNILNQYLIMLSIMLSAALGV